MRSLPGNFHSKQRNKSQHLSAAKIIAFLQTIQSGTCKTITVRHALDLAKQSRTLLEDHALTGNVRWMLTRHENSVKIIRKIGQHQIFMAEALSFGL
jgi:hypothetical protein